MTRDTFRPPEHRDEDGPGQEQDGREQDGQEAGRPERHETRAERDDRNLMELLQELRVAGLGVQVLFGFLLSLPFTNKFVKLNHAQRELYVASLLLAAVSTVLLVGPVAYHRLVFRRRQKEHLVRAANVMAITGLAAVGLAISAAVLLVISYVDQGWPVILYPACLLFLFAGLWFVMPIIRRERAEAKERSAQRSGL
jgi:Family of unknown function (DUF6328)